jgi:hypothetical protein
MAKALVVQNGSNSSVICGDKTRCGFDTFCKALESGNSGCDTPNVACSPREVYPLRQQCARWPHSSAGSAPASQAWLCCSRRRLVRESPGGRSAVPPPPGFRISTVSVRDVRIINHDCMTHCSLSRLSLHPLVSIQDAIAFVDSRPAVSARLRPPLTVWHPFGRSCPSSMARDWFTPQGSG